MAFPVLDKFIALTNTLGGIMGSNNTVVADPPSTTGWDKFINGLNRAGRPALLLGVTALFIAAYLDPTGFSAFALALTKLPEMAWYTIFSIITAWVTARGIADVRAAGASKAPASTDDTAVVETPVEEAPAASEGRFDNLEEDHPVLTQTGSGNSSIAEWKAQNEGK